MTAPNKKHWINSRGSLPSGCIACQTGTDVRVRVRRLVVQVQVEQSGLRAVAPVAAVLSNHPLVIVYRR